MARQLATVVSFGLSSAAAIYLGKTIGEKKTEHARAYSKRFILLSVIMGVLGGAVILAVSPFAAAALSLSETARGYLRFMFFRDVLLCGRAGVQYDNGRGNLPFGRGYQIRLILDVSTMWCCSILLGFIAAFVLKLSVPVVYVILMSDEIIKIPITTWRYRKYRWLRDVTREKNDISGMQA